MIRGVGRAGMHVKLVDAKSTRFSGFATYRPKGLFAAAMASANVHSVMVDAVARDRLNNDVNGIADRIVGGLNRGEKIGNVLANSLRGTGLEAGFAAAEEKGKLIPYIAGEPSNVSYMIAERQGLVFANLPKEVHVADELFGHKTEALAAPATFTGMKLAGGIGVGKTFLYYGPLHGIEVKEDKIPPDKVPDEIARFRAAFDALEKVYQARLQEAQVRFHNEPGVVAISSSLLNGVLKPFKARIEQVISEEHVNAEFAVQKVYTPEIAEMRSLGDKEFREEKQVESDLVGVMGELIACLAGKFPERLSGLAGEPVILVADEILPVDTLTIKANVKGIAVEKGGHLSHAALLAQKMGIPCVQINGIMKTVKPGQPAILDGERAMMVLNPSDQDVEGARDRIKELSIMQMETIREMKGLEPRMISGEWIRLYANIEGSQDLRSPESYGVEGVGLFRTDAQMGTIFNIAQESGQLSPEKLAAYETALVDEYVRIAQIIRGLPPMGEEKPRYVNIRTFDWGRDKHYGLAEKDALGVSGIRVYKFHKPVIHLQLVAILRASFAEPDLIRLTFPFIACYPDIMEAMGYLDEAKRDLLRRELAKHKVLFNDEKTEALEAKLAAKRIPLPYNPGLSRGIMMETPAALIETHQYVGEIDHASFGTNDLTQLLRAADRQNEKVSVYNTLMVPATFSILSESVKVLLAAGKDAGVCGKMASYLPSIPPLLGMGFDLLSMERKSIPAAKQLIRKLEMKVCRELAARVVRCRTSEEARQEVIRKYPELGNAG